MACTLLSPVMSHSYVLCPRYPSGVMRGRLRTTEHSTGLPSHVPCWSLYYQPYLAHPVMHLFRSAVVLCWCHPRARDHPRVDLSCCCAVPALCLTCILNAGGIDKRRGPAAIIFAVGWACRDTEEGCQYTACRGGLLQCCSGVQVRTGVRRWYAIRRYV